MQSAGAVNGYIADADAMLKSWGPLFAFLFVMTAVATIFLYREYWPVKKKRMEADILLATSRENLLHTLISTNQERADRLTKDNYAALHELTGVFQSGMEKLFAQGAVNSGKLDAILDVIPSMEEAERRWKQATERRG
jgi:hypothetical protein